jgi:hypothetical protein
LRKIVTPHGKTLEGFEDTFRSWSTPVQESTLRVLGAIHRMCRDEDERDRKDGKPPCDLCTSGVAHKHGTEFVECRECARKPGSPALCPNCLAIRDGVRTESNPAQPSLLGEPT